MTTFRELGWLVLVSSFLVAGCSSPLRVPATSPRDRRDLGRHQLRITTASPAAQQHFDRGLTLAYAFRHRAAEDEFRQAAAADPACAMAWWGVALVNGPHINFPAVPADHARTAWDALERAQARLAGVQDVERALIEALGARYRNPQPEDRAPLDQAYAESLRKVWQRFPTEADVGTLCAEALMDLHPWDLWTLTGEPQPWTPEIVEILERVQALNPRHPGALHLYIHAVEASTSPERAAAAADRLLTLVPGASHLVHMPAHIYARIGKWDAAADSNRQAMEADSVYRAAYPNPGFYAMYMAHNTHFLAFTSMMRGRSAEAVALARRMVAEIPESFLTEHSEIVDGYMIFVSEVLMRFGRWEDILAEPAPRPGWPVSQALWRFTRSIAYTALGRLSEAANEQAEFESARAAVPSGATFGNNRAADLLTIASEMLRGELAARKGQFDEAIRHLQQAVAVEDNLRYDEPPDWLQPVRHTLGAVLLRTGRWSEAEAVYRADLKKYPNNGWSLYGLARALRRLGRNAEARQVEQQFRRAWQDADIPLRSTCLCQPGV